MSSVLIYHEDMEPARTFDGLMVMVDSGWIRANSELMNYAKTSDGVWVPECDLQKYESLNQLEQPPSGGL